jgi:hypothetical protein
MGHEKTYKEASEVDAESGEVFVDGPDGVAVTLTSEAALETSDRLLKAGLKTEGQKVRQAKADGRRA